MFPVLSFTLDYPAIISSNNWLVWSFPKPKAAALHALFFFLPKNFWFIFKDCSNSSNIILFIWMWAHSSISNLFPVRAAGSWSLFHNVGRRAHIHTNHRQHIKTTNFLCLVCVKNTLFRFKTELWYVFKKKTWFPSSLNISRRVAA